MTHRPFRVLFLCTGNSARSVLAEAVLDRLGAGRFEAYSAGSHPVGQVNPFTLELLQEYGYETDKLRSKSWDEFAGPGAPVMDAIITVCDNAAGEVCPVWPGHPAAAHWGFEDPAAFQGSRTEKRERFEEIYQQIYRRIEQLASLLLETLDDAAREKLTSLGSK
jgi:arsenate reductase (thioredoxin)